MKLLQNRWVTSGLVVVAAGVVFYQFAPQIRRHGGAPAPRTVSSALTESTVPSVPAANPRTPPASRPIASAHTGLDLPYIQEHVSQWVDSPRRDPFLLLNVKRAESVLSRNDPPSPVAQWKLNAIWRQTGSRLAAINSGVYREGDSIHGYKVERIEDDQVVLRGTNGTQSLGFVRAPKREVVAPGASQASFSPPSSHRP